MSIKLINVNGAVGRGAYRKPDFPTLNALVDHMDYLQIDRSIVYHVEACNTNPTQGNRKLLQEIADADVGKRIIPAFIITPACFYENGSIDFLKECFSTGQVKVIRITPEISRFQIRQIERVLIELAPFKPLVLWDCLQANELDIRDIEYLAKKLPHINFALTQKMWNQFGSVIDLLWRCSNIYVDISWVHMRGYIELLCREFGASRILFGIGAKAHYGAPVASLTFAEISDENRELIAYKNIERLLDLEPLNCKLASSLTGKIKKPLWKKFSSGQKLDELEIIDGHGHTGAYTRGWYMKDNNTEGCVKTLLADMDKTGVDSIIVSHQGALFASCAQENTEAEIIITSLTDRFKGYLVFNPLFAADMLPLLDDFFSRKFFVGFKILPGYWQRPVTDSSYNPVWEYADKHRLPVLIHTWEGDYNSPIMLTDIAKKYPDAILLLAHSGGGVNGRNEAVKLVRDNKNVYLEFCGSFTCPDLYEYTITQVGINKIVFGSDTCAHNIAWELGRFLSMPIPDQELVPALAENIKKILAKKIS